MPGDSAQLSASNEGGSNDSYGSCGGYGPDVFYRLHLTQQASLSAAVSGPDGGFFESVLYLEDGTCSVTNTDAGFVGTGDLYCSTGFITTQLDVASLSPGDYTLVVDSNSAGSPFDLSVSLGAPIAPPANDTCANATALTPHNPGDTQNLGGTTFGASDDASACGPLGADVFYSLHLAQDAQVQLSATASNIQALGIYLLASCASTTPVGSCGNPVNMFAVPAGDYLVVVDGPGRSGDSFDLSVVLSAPSYPPANDQCSGATVLAAQAPGQSDSVSGTTYAAADDSTGSCSGPGPDVFYRVHLTQQASLSATLSMTDGGFFPTALYLQPGACPSGADAGGFYATDLVCSSGTGPVSVAAASLSPGDYTLVVDSSYGAGGPFDLSVNLAAPVAPPANDTCAGAIALTPHIPGDVQSLAGTTFGATDNAYGCAYQAEDVFYSLHLAQDARVQLSAQSTNSQLSPMLSVSASCSAADGGGGSTTCGSQLDLPVLPAGDYVVLVDGPRGGAPFNLSVNLGAPIYPPANDTCAGAQLLSPQVPGDTAQVDVTTAGAHDDQYTCGYGADVFYRLHLTQQASLVATLSLPPADGGFFFGYGSLQLQSDCGVDAGFGPDAGTNVIACANSTLPNTLGVNSLAPGDYVLVVDDGMSGGDYTLDVSLGAPH